MRSRTANALLLLLGLAFVALGADLYFDLIVGVLRDYRYVGLKSVDVYSLIFGFAYLSVGLWCAAGAISNFGNLESIRRKPVRADELLARWHLRIIIVAVVCEILAAIAHSRWRAIPFAAMKTIHWITIASVAAIPATLLVAMFMHEDDA